MNGPDVDQMSSNTEVRVQKVYAYTDGSVQKYQFSDQNSQFSNGTDIKKVPKHSASMSYETESQRTLTSIHKIAG